MTRLPRLVAGLASLALVGAAPAEAQVVEVASAEVLGARTTAGPRVTQPAVSLADAVELTLRHSPDINRAVERVRTAGGRRQQSKGLFDTTLRSTPDLTFTLQQLVPGLKSNEVSKRATIQAIANQYTLLSVILRQVIEDTPTDPIPCPSNLSFDIPGIGLDRLDDTTRRLLGVSRDLPGTVAINLGDLPTSGQLSNGAVVTGVDLGDICATPVEPFFSPEAFNGVLRRIDQAGGLGLGGVLTSVAQIPREIRILQEQIARTVALRAKLALDRLGPVAQDDLKRNFKVDLTVSRVFRNGLYADVAVELRSQEHNFVNKPLDPAFGGLGLPPQFYSSGSVSLNVPLFRGRGSRTTAAPERSAEYIEIGEREQLRHEVAQAVFRTVLAYLNLVAAQETERLLQDSVARHEQILALTRQRVSGGDVAGMEVGRVQARAASVASAAAQARAAVDEARIGLAEVMGVSARSLADAPRASDPLATAFAGLADPAALTDYALAARADARAARLRRSAAEILADGARVDQRGKLDLTFKAGLSNLYDSPLFRYLPDEAEPIIDETRAVPIASLTGVPVPPQSPVRFYDARGFYRALTSRHEPFVSVNITWELPFGNRAAKGRYAQAAATLQTSTIEARDLERVIDMNVLGASETVRRAADATAAWQTAVAHDEHVLAAALQQLQSGDLTILDTLLTEESVTTDQLQLVRQRQVYLSTLARLRFEAAVLVSFENPGTPAEQIRFPAGDFVRR